jgi:hypothetical protein
MLGLGRQGRSSLSCSYGTGEEKMHFHGWSGAEVYGRRVFGRRRPQTVLCERLFLSVMPWGYSASGGRPGSGYRRRFQPAVVVFLSEERRVGSEQRSFSRLPPRRHYLIQGKTEEAAQQHWFPLSNPRCSSPR